MKSARFSTGDAAVPGLVFGDRIVALAHLIANAPAEMNKMIARWDELRALLKM